VSFVERTEGALASVDAGDRSGIEQQGAAVHGVTTATDGMGDG
jgi:hypothetical protein